MNTRHASIRSLVSLTLLGILLAGGQTALGGPAKAPVAAWEGPSSGPTAAPALSPTLLRPAATAAPPRGFDALSATESQLFKYGFPFRPDARTDPKRYAGWLNVIHHMKHRVTPVLKPLPRVQFNVSSSSWAGSIVSTPPRCFYACYPNPYYVQEVAGMWTVPDVSGSTQDSKSAVWVGLDGVSGSPTGSKQVEQAGTGQDYSNGSPQYYFWVEEFPDDPYIVTNMSVSPGDNVYVDVYCNGSGVRFIIDNLTTGLYGDPIIFHANYGCPGDTGEFIVERPCTDATCTQHYPLADFNYVYMHDLYARVGNAWTGGNTVVGGTRSAFTTFQVDMTNDAGTATLAQTAAWSWMNNGMDVFWKGYQ